MTDTETKTIVGQCVQVEQKPGNEWVRFHIDVGSQYPVKLSTKKQEIIDAANAVGSDVATWTFSESQGNENPNRPGTYYVNRYLNAVEAGANPQQNADSQPAATASGTQQAAPATASGTATPVPTSQHPALAPADEKRAIARQACLKAAAWVYTGLGAKERVTDSEEGLLAEDPVVGAVIAAATRFEIWVFRDTDDLPF
jgi:hypothetical protein